MYPSGMSETGVLRAKIAVDAVIQLEKYAYLTNGLR